MKYLLSNNFKMNKSTAKDLVNKVICYKEYIDGFEMCPNYNSKLDIKFMEELAFECKKNNLVFQVHGDSSKTIKEQLNFFNELHKIANIVGYKIHVVLHPLYDHNYNKAFLKTNEYFSTLLSKSKKLDIIISIENLNSTTHLRRINLADIQKILYNIPNLKFTYDLGHAMVNNDNYYINDEEIINRISNIHLHTHNYGIDHQSIENTDYTKNEFIKNILFLKKIKYNNTIVFEYDFNSLGNNYDERLKNYVESIKYIRSYFE